MSTDTAFGRTVSSDDLVLTLLDRMIWPILIGFSIVIAVAVPGTFENLNSVEFILHGSVGLGFLALAESVALISGHFDLSVGAIAGFSAMVAGLALSPTGWAISSSPLVGVLLVVLVGSFVGGVNGLMISRLGINPFLQTLAMLIILEGAKLSLSTVTIASLPDGYTAIGNDAWVAIATLFVAFAVVGLLLRYTEFGQAIYGLGSDEDAARAVGVDTGRLIVVVYVISGLLSGIGGLMLTGYVSVVPPSIGEGLVFQAFAAAVIGGISLFGGRGKITGALGGVVLLGLIQASLNISGTAPEHIRLINGLVLLAAIVLYNSRKDLRERVLTQEV